MLINHQYLFFDICSNPLPIEFYWSVCLLLLSFSSLLFSLNTSPFWIYHLKIFLPLCGIPSSFFYHYISQRRKLILLNVNLPFKNIFYSIFLFTCMTVQFIFNMVIDVCVNSFISSVVFSVFQLFYISSLNHLFL